MASLQNNQQPFFIPFHLSQELEEKPGEHRIKGKYIYNISVLLYCSQDKWICTTVSLLFAALTKVWLFPSMNKLYVLELSELKVPSVGETRGRGLPPDSLASVSRQVLGSLDIQEARRKRRKQAIILMQPWGTVGTVFTHYRKPRL